MAYFKLISCLVNSFLLLYSTNALSIEDVKPEYCENVEYMPANCIKYGEKYYFLEYIPNTDWLEAQHICRRNNGNLVTIETADEMQAISDYLKKEGYLNYDDWGIWTAGSDLVMENDFMSIGNGQWLLYKKWAPNQPKKGAHCIALLGHNDEFLMHTADCQERYHYLCELNTTSTKRKQ